MWRCFNSIKCGREVDEYEACESIKSGDLEAILMSESTFQWNSEGKARQQRNAKEESGNQ